MQKLLFLCKNFNVRFGLLFVLKFLRILDLLSCNKWVSDTIRYSGKMLFAILEWDRFKMRKVNIFLG